MKLRTHFVNAILQVIHQSPRVRSRTPRTKGRPAAERFESLSLLLPDALILHGLLAAGSDPLILGRKASLEHLKILEQDSSTPKATTLH
jgi:hypothetical protein